MNKKKKSLNRGITLIALVMTIVVLLILVGVTISTLTGENGILQKSFFAKEESNKKTATETLNLKITHVQMITYAEKQRMPTLKELADDFCNDDDFAYVQETSEIASLEPITNPNPSIIYTKLKEFPYEFGIDEHLKLASIDGIKIADNSTSSNELESLKTTVLQLNTKIEELNTEITNLKQQKDLVTQCSTFSINEQKIKGDAFYLSQYGNVVSISIDGLKGSQNITPNQSELLASGLPKCAMLFQDLTVTLDTNDHYARCWIDSYGNLFLYTSASNYTGNIFIGGTYLTK